MRFALDVCAYLVGIPLEVLILAAMLRGSYRRYPALFVYMAVVFVVSLLETSLYIVGYLDATWYRDRHVWTQYLKCYWVDEGIMMVLEFVVSFSLICKATERTRSRRMLRASVVCSAVLVYAITFWRHYDPGVATGQWMNAWTSDLNFYYAILDLGLWVMLLGSRAKDSRLLMFSGALGILFTGAAISGSISNLAVAKRSSPLTFAGGVVNILSNLTFLYVWWQALRSREASDRSLPYGRGSEPEASDRPLP
jgi:hypothetical protein